MLERDIYFLRKAFEVAHDLSQDANTQTGAVIVNKSDVTNTRFGEIVSVGANTMHLGMPGRYEGGHRVERVLLGRPEKYTDLTHAERDAVYGALRMGTGHLLNGATMYCTWAPCKTCAEVIANSGIKRVVTSQLCDQWYAEKGSNISRVDWDKDIKLGLALLQKTGVQYECLDVPIEGIEILFDNVVRRT